MRDGSRRDVEPARGWDHGLSVEAVAARSVLERRFGKRWPKLVGFARRHRRVVSEVRTQRQQACCLCRRCVERRTGRGPPCGRRGRSRDGQRADGSKRCLAGRGRFLRVEQAFQEGVPVVARCGHGRGGVDGQRIGRDDRLRVGSRKEGWPRRRRAQHSPRRRRRRGTCYGCWCWRDVHRDDRRGGQRAFVRADMCGERSRLLSLLRADGPVDAPGLKVSASEWCDSLNRRHSHRARERRVERGRDFTIVVSQSRRRRHLESGARQPMRRSERMRCRLWRR